MGKWLKCGSYIQWNTYDSSSKRNIYAHSWTKLKIIMLNEKSQSQNIPYFFIVYITF